MSSFGFGPIQRSSAVQCCSMYVHNSVTMCNFVHSPAYCRFPSIISYGLVLHRMLNLLSVVNNYIVF